MGLHCQPTQVTYTCHLELPLDANGKAEDCIAAAATSGAGLLGRLQDDNGNPVDWGEQDADKLFNKDYGWCEAPSPTIRRASWI
jgi:hypothetical protein